MSEIIWHDFDKWNVIVGNQKFPIQEIVLPGDIQLIDNQISIPPDYVPIGGHEPGPVKQWYGQIGQRTFVLQFHLPIGTEPQFDWVTLITPYNQSMDWRVLEEFHSLPYAVLVSHPILIQSPNIASDHIVCRENKGGWFDPVYRASSRDDAQGLVDFLSRDHGNGLCKICPAEESGIWGVFRIVNGIEEFACNAYSKSTAFQIAARKSIDNNSTIAVRKDYGDDFEYRLENGRIVSTKGK